MRWTKEDEAAAKVGGYIIKFILLVIFLLLLFSDK